MVSEAMHAGHPTHEVLADLAADVLTYAEARAVEAHVLGCASCTGLLGDAERVRPLLKAQPAEPMPVELWDRLQTTLSTEAGLRAAASVDSLAEQRTGHEAQDDGWGQGEWFTQEWPVVPPEGVAGPEPVDASTAQWSQFIDPPPVDEARRHRNDGTPAFGVPLAVPLGAQAPADPDPDNRAGADDTMSARARRWRSEDGSDLGDAQGAPGQARSPLGLRATRAGRSSRRSGSGSGSGSAGAPRSRRDLRTENRGLFSRHSLSRYGTQLGVAAAVLLVAVLGGVLLKVLPSADSSGGTSTAAAGLAESGPAGPNRIVTAGVVLATGTDYTDKDIVQKALALPPVASGAQSALAVSSATSPATVRGDASSGKSAVPPAAVAPAAVPQPKVVGNASLLKPATLAACLTELGATGQQPIVVDLARYQGRDAAILVLTGRDGGYEVWAVARDCRPGAGGQLVYKSVPPR